MADAFDWSGFGSGYGSKGSSSSGSSSSKKKKNFDWGDFASNYGYLSEQDQKDLEAQKTLDKLAAAETAQQQADANKPGFWQGVGGFLKDSGKAIAENYDRIGKGSANVIADVTGVNQQQRDLQAKTQAEDTATIAKLGAKMRTSTDPAEKERYRQAIQKISGLGDQQDQAFQQDQQRIVEQNDPTKGAAATAGIGLDVITGGKFSSGVKVLQTAKTLTNLQKVGKVVKGAASGAGIGAAYGADQTFVNDGADVKAEDLVKNTATGAALGAAIPLAGSTLKKGFDEVGKVVRGKGTTSLEKVQAAEDKALLTKASTQENEVVQVVNPKTGEKTFYRIPKDQRDEIVNSIDGTANGTAGKNVGGNVTHITARTPEDMAKKGFKDGGVYGDDTVNPVGKAVDNVATKPGETAVQPGMQASRYVSKTLPESDFVGAETKKKLGAEYQATTNAQRADTSLQQLDAEGVDNFSTKVNGRLDGKTITDQTVFDAQAAAQALEKEGSEGSLQRASEIYNKLSTHLSKAGQTVQAASIMARQSPQGLAYYAAKQFKEHGVTLTKEKQQELNQLINKVKEAPAKSDEMALARDNVQYFIAQNVPATTSDKIVNFWRAGLLTAPTTTGGAIVGNVAQTISRKLITNPVAVGADLLQSFITKERSQTFARAGEAGKGALEGAKAVTNKQYWKTGYNPLEAGENVGKFDQNRMLNYGDTALGKVTGRYVNGVYQVMGAADQPFRGAARRESLSSQANAIVANEKIKGRAAKNARYKELMANPTTEMSETAQKEAKYNVFANDTALSSIVQGAKNNLRAKGMNKSAAFVDFLTPFVKVPSAVAARIIDQTPIGTAREIAKQVVRVRNGEKWDQRAVSRAVGEGTMALPILGAGFALAQNGDITGGYPSSQEERDAWQKAGKQPNSIRIGDRWYSMNYIQPFGTIMAIGAGISDAKKTGADTGEIISQALASGGKAFINQSFLQGISSGLDAVNNPVQFAGKYASNTASGIIPNIIRSGVRASDPVQRDTKGFVEGIKSGIPGLAQTNPVKTDSENNPIPAKDNFANQYFNPLKPSVDRSTPDTVFYDQAVKPAAGLKTVRQREINDLLTKGQVNAAQRKIDQYNEDVTKIIAPYVAANKDKITQDQLDRIDNLYLGKVFINSKGRPYLSSRDDLPQ